MSGPRPSRRLGCAGGRSRRSRRGAGCVSRSCWGACRPSPASLSPLAACSVREIARGRPRPGAWPRFPASGAGSRVLGPCGPGGEGPHNTTRLLSSRASLLSPGSKLRSPGARLLWCGAKLRSSRARLRLPGAKSLSPGAKSLSRKARLRSPWARSPPPWAMPLRRGPRPRCDGSGSPPSGCALARPSSMGRSGGASAARGCAIGPPPGAIGPPSSRAVLARAGSCKRAARSRATGSSRRRITGCTTWEPASRRAAPPGSTRPPAHAATPAPHAPRDHAYAGVPDGARPARPRPARAFAKARGPSPPRA